MRAHSISVFFGAVFLFMPSVFAQDTMVIEATGNSGKYNSVNFVNGKIVVAYRSDERLKIWSDDGQGGGMAGDFRPNGSEIRTLDSQDDFGTHPVVDSWQGHLVIAWNDTVNHQVKVWIDDGIGGIENDRIVQPGEIRFLGGPWVQGQIGIGSTSAGQIAISYQSAPGVGSNRQLHLWVDDGGVNGLGVALDAQVQGDELRIIDNGEASSLLDVGAYSSVATSPEGFLSIAYQNETEGKPMLWVDDGHGGGIAGDLKKNGEEIRILDPMGGGAGNGFYLNLLTLDGLVPYLAACYYNAAGIELRLWVDDGLGGGVAGNRMPEPGEIRSIGDGSLASRGRHCAMTVQGGVLSIASATLLGPIGAGNLELWQDDGAGRHGIPGDHQSNGNEYGVIDHNNTGFSDVSIASKNGFLVLTYYDERRQNLKMSLLSMNATTGNTAGNLQSLCTPDPEAFTLDAATRLRAPSILSSQSMLAASYFDGPDLKLWVDDGNGGGIMRDNQVNGSEVRLLDSFVFTNGDHTDLVADSSGRLAILYHANFPSELWLWVDDGKGGGVADDFSANGSEVRFLGSGIGSRRPALAIIDGFLTLSYADILQTSQFFWKDDGLAGGIAGDGDINGAELRVLESGSSGGYSSIVSHQNSLAISFSSGGDLKLWVDDGQGGGIQGDARVNGGEIRAIDVSSSTWPFYTNLISLGDHLAISYYDASLPNQFLLWIDAGVGGGVANDYVINGSELQFLGDMTVSTVEGLPLFQSQGSLGLAAHDRTSGQLQYWVDLGCQGGGPGNRQIDPEEVFSLVTSLPEAYFDITLHDGKLWVAYTDVSLFPNLFQLIRVN